MILQKGTIQGGLLYFFHPQKKKDMANLRIWAGPGPFFFTLPWLECPIKWPWPLLPGKPIGNLGPWEDSKKNPKSDQCWKNDRPAGSVGVLTSKSWDPIDMIWVPNKSGDKKFSQKTVEVKTPNWDLWNTRLNMASPVWKKKWGFVNIAKWWLLILDRFAISCCFSWFVISLEMAIKSLTQDELEWTVSTNKNGSCSPSSPNEWEEEWTC